MNIQNKLPSFEATYAECLIMYTEILAINAPVVYMVRCEVILMRETSIQGAL